MGHTVIKNKTRARMSSLKVALSDAAEAASRPRAESAVARLRRVEAGTPESVTVLIHPPLPVGVRQMEVVALHWRHAKLMDLFYVDQKRSGPKCSSARGAEEDARVQTSALARENSETLNASSVAL